MYFKNKTFIKYISSLALLDNSYKIKQRTFNFRHNYTLCHYLMKGFYHQELIRLINLFSNATHHFTIYFIKLFDCKNLKHLLYLLTNETMILL